MDPSDIKQIKEFQIEKIEAVQIILKTDESQFSSKIVNFTHELKKLLPGIIVKKEPVGIDEYAGLQIGSGLNCHFIPHGPKLKGFLQALEYSSEADLSFADGEYELFKNLDLPASLTLYVADGCPHCPKVFSQLSLMPFVNFKIRLSVFDPLFFTDLAEKNAIKAVPTVLLDDDFRWTGAVDLSELARVITTRDPSKLSVDSLDMLLKEGNAETLAQMMQRSGEIYPAFIKLLTHPAWSTRLGAMVVMENLIESDPQLAIKIQKPIWQNFNTVSDPVKGDLLYIIGELHSENDKSKLTEIISGDHNKEVKEAADEALAKLSGI